jgi:hypothetical protein
VLTQVAEGVLVHQSELLQNNAVVVQGRAGVLLIDPGIQGSEMACLALSDCCREQLLVLARTRPPLRARPRQ